jgi:OOP family OmpA-OmpF porin
MEAKAMGEAQLVTKAGECPRGTSAKVIGCLQPNRRVELEAVGIRTAR